MVRVYEIPRDQPREYNEHDHPRMRLIDFLAGDFHEKMTEKECKGRGAEPLSSFIFV